jgi:hypothetical protein
MFHMLSCRHRLASGGPMTGEELAALVNKVSQTPTAVVGRINRMLADKK